MRPLSVQSLSMLGLIAFAGGCNAGTRLESPPGLPTATLAELVAGTPDRDGQRIQVPQAVVLAEDTFDEVGSNRIGTVYFADPAGAERGRGMQAFAPNVRVAAGHALSPGDLVSITGTFVRFLGPNCASNPSSCFPSGRVLPQMSSGAVIDRIGFWHDLEPIELTVQEYLNDAPLYVGSLITLRDLEATGGYAPASGGTRLAPFETMQGVTVSGELYVIPDVTAGTSVTRLTGIASYFYGDFVVPRSADDVELGEDTAMAELGPDACNDGEDNDGDDATDCADTDCCTEARCHTLILTEAMPNPVGEDAGAEWVEIHNTADYPVTAVCMALGRGEGAWSRLSPLWSTIPAQGCAVVGMGPDMPAVETTFDPALADGGSPGVGIGLFVGPVAGIGAESTPFDALIYGDDNLDMLIDSSGVAPTGSHVAAPPEGSSLSRDSADPTVWTVTATPTPGDCSHAM